LSLRLKQNEDNSKSKGQKNLKIINRGLHGGIYSKCIQEGNGHLQLHPR
jgi:hypothetical protein